MGSSLAHWPRASSLILGSPSAASEMQWGMRSHTLKPIAAPQESEMHGESLCGTCLVGTIVVLCVNGVRNSEVAFFRNAVLVEAVVALTCLAGLLFGDPGVVHRTSTSTSPLPPAVAERMEAELDVKGLQNLTGPDGKSSYCVRCLVWRRGRRRGWHELDVDCASDDNADWDCFPHHCSVCQRCARSEGCWKTLGLYC